MENLKNTAEQPQPMSLTAMTIKNTSDVNISASNGVGSVAVDTGNNGTISDEFIWYTLTCYEANSNKQLAQKEGCYGSDTFTFSGSQANGYSISKD